MRILSNELENNCYFCTELLVTPLPSLCELWCKVQCVYVCLSWLEGLFLTGCRRSLNQCDLYAHPGEADSERLLHTFN